MARPIAHGVSLGGFAMRHIVSSFFPGEPERMTRFKTRITSPVLPGTLLETSMWFVGDGEIRFQLVDADADETGVRPHLNYGICEWR